MSVIKEYNENNKYVAKINGLDGVVLLLVNDLIFCGYTEEEKMCEIYRTNIRNPSLFITLEDNNYDYDIKVNNYVVKLSERELFMKDIKEYEPSYCIYYESGNPQYVGDLIQHENKYAPSGHGIREYYDKDERRLKYCGDMVNGGYTGYGIFYSFDGNKTIEVEMDDNLPYGEGIVTIDGLEYVVNFDNYDLIDLDIDMESETFVNDIVDKTNDEYTDALFMSMSTSEQLLEIYKLLENIIST